MKNHSSVCLDWKKGSGICHLQKIPFSRNVRRRTYSVVTHRGSVERTVQKDHSMTEQNIKTNFKRSFLKLQIGSEVKLKMSSCYIVQLLKDDLHIMTSPKEESRSATYKIHHLKLPPVDVIQTPSVLCCLLLHWITHIPQLLHCLVLCSMSTSKGLAEHE